MHSMLVVLRAASTIKLFSALERNDTFAHSRWMTTNANHMHTIARKRKIQPSTTCPTDEASFAEPMFSLSAPSWSGPN